MRGEHKLPGEIRRNQNWIGGAFINDARFIPPVHKNVGELMSDLKKLVHNDLKQWFRFFLAGVLETAEKWIATFDSILTLKSEKEAIIQSTSA